MAEDLYDVVAELLAIEAPDGAEMMIHLAGTSGPMETPRFSLKDIQLIAEEWEKVFTGKWIVN